MLAIKPRSHHRGDEELGSVGVGPSIGHGQKARLSVLQLEVLIWKEGERFIAGQSRAPRAPTAKFIAIDRSTTSAVVGGEITALKHEPRDHAVEGGIRVTITLLTSREHSEVLCGLGNDTVVQCENDSTSRISTDSDVKLKGQEANMSKHAKWVDAQKRKYVDVVGHGCLVV